MSRLPRYPQDKPATGADLNLILAILDTGGVINIASANNSGVSGDSLTPNIPNVAGSISPNPGGVGAPATPRGFSGAYGIDNFAQAHTAYVILSWTPNPVTDFVSRYDIYYHKGSDPTLYNVSVSGSANSIRVNNLFPGNTYSFSISAHDAANRASLWSPELTVVISPDSDPPAIPGGLTATSTAGGVFLVWSEVGSDGFSNDLKQYQIAVSLDGGATYPTLLTVGPGNSYLYAPVTGNQGTVFFKVASVDWTGNISAFGSAVSAAVGTSLGPITQTSASITPLTGNSNTGILTLKASDATTNNFIALDFNNTGQTGPVGRIAMKYTGAGTEMHFGVSNNYANGITLDAVSINQVGNVSVLSGSLTVANALTVTAGDLTLSGAAAKLLMNGTGTSAIVPGTTGLNLQNNANNATNAGITDLGLMTLRNAIQLPPSAGGTVATTSYGSMPVKIAENLLGGSTATITFSSIPSGFRHLLLEWYCRSDVNAGNSSINLRLNNDSAANYDHEFIQILNTQTTTSQVQTLGANSIQVGQITSNTATANYFSQGEIKIKYYAGTTGNKLVLWQSCFSGSNGATDQQAWMGMGKWRTTGTAINRLDLAPNAFSGNFVTDSLFTLWGIP